jgi:NAD(P)H dehydrogenase (quinone)
MVEYMGIEALEPFVAYAAPRVDQTTREAYLQKWREHIVTIAGEDTGSAKRKLAAPAQ